MSNARIVALGRNAAKRQWSLVTDINWRMRVVAPWWLPRKAYVAMVSQLYHAEVVAMRMCRRLQHELPEPEAKRFLETQRIDELRHVEAYRAYLERLGDIAPINEAMATALEGGLAWSGSYHGAVVAFNVVLEGEAVQLQQELGEMFPCPLFRQINARVSLDEARHVAFGKIYLPDKLKALPWDERLAIYRWVKELWHVCADANNGCRIASSAIIRLGRRRLEERWLNQRQTLIDIGLITRQDAALVETGEATAP